MKAGMIFPGQGSQFVGMGKDLYDAFESVRDLYNQANAALGFDIAEMSFSGDLETLTETHNAQPALLVHSLAVCQLVSERGVEPSVVAGHSLGEFAALVAAGFFRPMDALQIVRRRGELMFEAGKERPGTMASVIGLDQADVEACVERVRNDGGVVVVANFNSPGQFVVSGEVSAVEAASEACREAGARRVIPLTVSGAFHSPLMEPTVDEFEAYVESFEHSTLRVPWISNVTGRPTQNAAEVVDLLAHQLSSPVRWIESMESLAARVDGPVFEVGPGKVLSGLMKRISPQTGVVPVGDVESLQAV